MSINNDIWYEIDDDGISGLEAQINDFVMMDVICYQQGEYSWMLREWASDNDCQIAASYDSDLYYETADKALASLIMFLEETRSDIYALIESHPIRDSLAEFGRKALSIGFAITLATAGIMGGIAAEPAEAQARPYMLTTAVLVSILNDHDEVNASTVMTQNEILDTVAITYDNDILQDAIGSSSETDIGGGYAYLIGSDVDVDHGQYVALAFDDGSRAIVDDADLWSEIHAELAQTGAQAIDFDSLTCDTAALADYADAPLFPKEVFDAAVSGIFIVVIIGTIGATIYAKRKEIF